MILTGALVLLALWLFHGGLLTIERARSAGEYLRSWSSAIAGAAVALFIIADVMPHLGHG